VNESDRYDLRRFVDMQHSVFEQVRAELQAGRKLSHWMWFIFPQFKGLGHSPMAAKFAISSRHEAEAYLQHRILGPRLNECTRMVLDIQNRSIAQIFGYPDDLKFRSSMTLFANIASDNPLFAAALQKYFAGEPDNRTVELLQLSP
jgi:uncharacterized protein (DUF1810 family)